MTLIATDRASLARDAASGKLDSLKLEVTL
jgi:hypothetical protein